MILTNKQIFDYVDKLTQHYNNTAVQVLPVRLSFHINKNLNNLLQRFTEIDSSRMQIAQRFGILNDEGDAFDIPVEKTNEVRQEMESLMSITQDVPIHVFLLSEFDNINLSYAQLDALSFMIEED